MKTWAQIPKPMWKPSMAVYTCNYTAGIGVTVQTGGSPGLTGQPVKPTHQALVRELISKIIMWKQQRKMARVNLWPLYEHAKEGTPIHTCTYMYAYTMQTDRPTDKGVEEKCVEEARVSHKACKFCVKMSVLIRELLALQRHPVAHVTWWLVLWYHAACPVNPSRAGLWSYSWKGRGQKLQPEGWPTRMQVFMLQVFMLLCNPRSIIWAGWLNSNW